MTGSEWLASLNDSALDDWAKAVHQEQEKRARKSAPPFTAPAELQAEIQNLEAGWTQIDEDRKQQAAKAQRALLEMRRDDLRNGTWTPSHRCPQCLAAILTMDPEKICDYARQHGPRWWTRS